MHLICPFPGSGKLLWKWSRRFEKQSGPWIFRKEKECKCLCRLRSDLYFCGRMNTLWALSHKAKQRFYPWYSPLSKGIREIIGIKQCMGWQIMLGNCSWRWTVHFSRWRILINFYNWFEKTTRAIGGMWQCLNWRADSFWPGMPRQVWSWWGSGFGKTAKSRAKVGTSASSCNEKATYNLEPRDNTVILER